MVQLTVSPSEFDSYMSCPRKHYYAYGLKIQSRESSDSLNRGTIGHHFLEEYFKLRLEGMSADTAMLVSKQYMTKYVLLNPEQMTIADEAKEAILRFFDDGGYSEFEILAIEREFQVVIDENTGASILFKVDLIVRDKDGKIGIIDHKFISQLYAPYQLDLMSQLPKYYEALKRLGYPIDWVAYGEYKAGSGPKFVFLPFPLSEASAKRTMEEHRQVANKIIGLKRQAELDKTVFYWSETATRIQNTMICKNCSFKKICVAELKDDHPDLVLDQFYKVKEYDNGPGGTLPTE